MRVWVIGLLIVLGAVNIAFADQKIEIIVPDNFTEADISYVKELANVGKERIIFKPILPPDTEVVAAKEKVDEYRVKDALPTKYKVVAEVAEPVAEPIIEG
jgi:hypothetical protein